MAGLGFKDFQVGEVLTSADVDGYLMQQTVMRFADNAARGSALGTATGTAVPLAEGMMSYLDDTNAVQVYTGSGWQNVTGIRQVVQTVKDDTFTTADSTFDDITGLAASITPSATTSKVLVQVNFGAIDANNATGVFIRVDRNGTSMVGGASPGSRIPVFGFAITPASDRSRIFSLSYLDSPASTSSLTYQVQAYANSTNILYINRAAQDLDNTDYGRAVSSVILMEVAG